MLRIPQRTHNILLNFICDDFPLETQLHKRFIKFAYNIVHSPNICVHICGKLALFGSMSDLCDSINYVFNRYEINKYDLLSKKLYQLMSKVNHHVITHADINAFYCSCIIRDFLVFKKNCCMDPKLIF